MKQNNDNIELIFGKDFDKMFYPNKEPETKPTEPEIKKIKQGDAGSYTWFMQLKQFEEKPKQYILYKVTNMINGMEYIGQHQTYDMDDKYLGSGSYLLWAVKKYGCSNFKKEVLAIYENENDLDKAEAEYVNNEYIKRTDTYNIIRGGRYIDLEHYIQKEWKPITGEFKEFLNDRPNLKNLIKNSSSRRIEKFENKADINFFEQYDINISEHNTIYKGYE